MNQHPHAAAIDRIGRDIVAAHYGVTRQTIYNWRKSGVPAVHRRTLAMLAVALGHAAPELDECQNA